MDPTAFDHWFEEKFTWSAVGKGKPGYDLYRRFLSQRGDVQYLYWLENLLRMGDELVDAAREDVKAGARKRRITSELLEFINSPFMNYVGNCIISETIEAVEKQCPGLDPVFSSSQWLENNGEEIVQKACLGASVLHFRSRVQCDEKRERGRAAFGNLMSILPLYEIMWRYAIDGEMDHRPKGGKPPDYWGTFFLLAVSEHLRDRSKLPQFELCHTLLIYFRRTRKDSPKMKISAKLAEARVSNLKKMHSLRWPSDLEILREFCSKFPLIRPSVPINLI